MEEHENFNIELQRSRGVAIAILGRRCLMGRLLLRSSVRLIGLVDQLSVHIMTGWGSQADQQIWLPGVSVSVVHRCRSLLLTYSICYLGILGLEEAKNCILARTSHQRTTSQKLCSQSVLYSEFHCTWHNFFYARSEILHVCAIPTCRVRDVSFQ